MCQTSLYLHLKSCFWGAAQRLHCWSTSLQYPNCSSEKHFHDWRVPCVHLQEADCSGNKDIGVAPDMDRELADDSPAATGSTAGDCLLVAADILAVESTRAVVGFHAIVAVVEFPDSLSIARMLALRWFSLDYVGVVVLSAVALASVALARGPSYSRSSPSRAGGVLEPGPHVASPLSLLSLLECPPVRILEPFLHVPCPSFSLPPPL